ncbi:unnamed protein product [Trifolium pratense]|uniref:Uncharacterized protein n=1 Tax=Trifolium pratense TaxID=57577 RepID=A0ACB0KYT1_TRIPR|nr:unnamed protein product [Trifolium pratense]
MPCSCQNDLDDRTTAVYIVTLRQVPTSHYQDELSRLYNHFRHSASGRTGHHKPRHQNVTKDKIYPYYFQRQNSRKQIMKIREREYLPPISSI